MRRPRLHACLFAALVAGAACGGSASPADPTSAGAGAGAADASSDAAVSSELPAVATPRPLGQGLGAYPVLASPPSRGGTMTFTDVGAPGDWPRRLDRPAGDAACTYKDGADTWGGHCCQRLEHTESRALAPFDREMTLILKAIDLKQLAVYQPGAAAGDWSLVGSWDRRSRVAQNLGFTKDQDQVTEADGLFMQDDCVRYVAQPARFDCGDGKDYFCPQDPGIERLGFTGSKLFVLLASMTFDDTSVKSCSGNGPGAPGPWLALSASELMRDGARKWNGACNCYSKTGTVGDGCGEINLFEVVMDGNAYSNREFVSSGLRSYQAGSVGGNVCGSGCARGAFADDVEVVDACAKKAYAAGPTIPVGGKADGCPVWKRPVGDRYFVVLLDERTRTIQLAVIHPGRVPEAARTLLPELPAALPRETIDALVGLRLPAP